MEILRTPDECFDELPGYPYAPRYQRVSADHELRMHYVDEGPRDGRVVLMLHGEPSWSYLYRTMIPIFCEAGCRAIAPDLIGFGKSDKPAAADDYSYARHVEWVESFLLGLDLKNVILVCQDWGGLIGLRLVAAHPERFAAVVASNTFLPTGDEQVPDAFHAWRRFAAEADVMPISEVVQRGTERTLHASVRAAYDAPFPEERYKVGARVFPALVPTEPDAEGAADNRAAWERLALFDGPFLTAFGDRDPITRGADVLLRERVAGAERCAPVTLAGAGHFVQEDRGPELAALTLTLAAGL